MSTDLGPLHVYVTFIAWSVCKALSSGNRTCPWHLAGFREPVPSLDAGRGAWSLIVPCLCPSPWETCPFLNGDGGVDEERVRWESPGWKAVEGMGGEKCSLCHQIPKITTQRLECGMSPILHSQPSSLPTRSSLPSMFPRKILLEGKGRKGRVCYIEVEHVSSMTKAVPCITRTHSGA